MTKEENLYECKGAAGSLVFRRQVYVCEKHGEIGNHMVLFNLPNREIKKYCLYCYQDMVAKYCFEAKEQE